MMPVTRRSFLGVALAVVLVFSGVVPGARPADPVRAQDDDGYTVTVVGGEDAPQTYADQTVEGFAFTNFTYRSRYPGGMEFKVTITPPDGVSVRQVVLFYTFSTGKRGRVNAELGDNPGEWIAVPYDARGLPPWHEVDAYWGVRTTDDQGVDSQPEHAIYYDATREWYRAENEDVLVYWYGMPEELGQYVLDAMAGNRQKYQDGFGMVLPYRPLSVIFPPGGDWNEYKGDETVDDTEFGHTGTIIAQAGSTIQRVRTLEPASIRADCIWNPTDPTVEFQMNQAASTTTHEVAHLYQQEIGVAGPGWWLEGQATFFETFEEYPVHDRLRTLAKMRDGDLPSFQGDGPGGGPFTVAEDGCTHLMYDMGASFMRWLVAEHGGMDTYLGIVNEMARAIPLEQALETVTGMTFLELENEWRAFLGVGEVPLDVLDPAAALDDPIEPFFAEGESVTLPAAPFQSPIYNYPTTTSIADAMCFGNMPVTILNAGSDGVMNWYEVDCMGMIGWMNQGQLVAQ
ncbi:MAG: hypothetical protein JW966_13900 [Anaerolineae bacterium]|nr:hypothetical protein [Anaerolineae bacterium]